MEDVPVPQTFYVSTNHTDTVSGISRTTHVSQSQCSRTHGTSPNSRATSRRQARVSRAVNFLLYGITLLIPGLAMIVVYFLVFRIPAGDVEWSPADAFVITGSILVGFSIVSECIGMWQYCMSRYESDEPTTTARPTAEAAAPYSDSPPSYNTIALDLPDLVISVVQDADERPPSFDSCVANHRPLPGLDNQAFVGLTDEDDLYAPPSYPGSLKRKNTGKVLFMNRNTETERGDADHDAEIIPKPSP